MGWIPSTGYSRTGKATILIMDLIKEVKDVILGINQYRMILHIQKKSQRVAAPHLEK